MRWSPAGRSSRWCRARSTTTRSAKNSFELARRLPNADLVVHPDAGHGGIFQFHEQFVVETLDFLER
jgi:pimeloyl-ACP methyl ester carboxylesterase